MSEQEKNQNNRSLYEQFAYVQRLLGRCHHHGRGGHGPGNPYHGQGRVLKLLRMQPEMSQRDMLVLLDMRPQSLGELLAKLEHRGYITRFPSEDDKRVMMVHLTEKGMEAKNHERGRSKYAKVFECLSEDEQAKLGEYLDRIIEELEKQFESDKDWPENRCRDCDKHGRHRRVIEPPEEN